MSNNEPETITINATDKCDYCDEKMKFAGANKGIMKVIKACAKHLKKANADLRKERDENN